MKRNSAVKGYVVIDTEPIDPEANSEYVEKVLPVIAAHGGRFLVRTGDVTVVHGDWAPKRLVILEFESLEAARGFVGSAEFSALDDLRDRAAKSRTVIVEGADAQA